MSGPQKIFVDFNNRLNRGDGNEFYRVSLSELKGLSVGSKAIATDYEDIELLVQISAKLHREKTAIVQVVRMAALPSVSMPIQPAQDRQPIPRLEEFGQRLIGV